MTYLYSYFESNNESKQIKRSELNQLTRENILNTVNSYYKQIFYDFHPFGYVFFSKQITNRKNIQLFNSQDEYMLQSSDWTIRFANDLEIQNWNRKFQLIKQADIAKFQCHRANLSCSFILKSISSIDFFMLTDLALYDCRIQNIEEMAFLNAPSLKKINLIYNKTVQFKSLKKTNFKLATLQMYYMSQKDRMYQNESLTPYLKLDHSQRWNFPLHQLRLQKHSYNVTIMNDLSFLAKLKSIDLSVYMKTTRIKQRKTNKVFNKQKKITFINFSKQLNEEGPLYPEQMQIEF